MGADSQVKFDGRSFILDGILLLQDREDTSAYYYLPKFPVISTQRDSSLEFLCIKYIGADEQSSGGIFHALFEFDVPEQLLASVEHELQEQLPEAYIKSRVPILPNTSRNGEDNSPSFEIISSILTNGGEGGMARSLVASGSAPLTPGSKVAIASMLDSKGATLFWNSLQGASSDLSIGVRGYYEATLPSFNATITIDMEKVYTKFNSSTKSKTSLFGSRDINRTIDTLRASGGIQIEIADRSQAFDIDETSMNTLVDMISTKVTDMLFETGEGDMGADLVGMGAGMGMGGMDMAMMGVMSMMSMGGGGGTGKKLSGVAKAALALGGVSLLADYKKATKYKLKAEETINLSKYIINLNKQTSIKVPFYCAGNIGGLYDAHKDDDRYFRVVDLDDVTFQERDIAFQIDGSYVEAFDDLLNFVTVKFRKPYPNGRDTLVKEVMFRGADLDEGVNLKSLSYPRLDLGPDEFNKYEYQLSWSLMGKDKMIHFPQDKNKWIKTDESAIALAPPLIKQIVDIDAGRDLFMMNGFSSANIRFATLIDGSPVPVRSLLLRVIDAEWNSQIIIYHDEGQQIVYQTTWYGSDGEVKEPLAVLKSDYLFLTPPPPISNYDED